VAHPEEVNETMTIDRRAFIQSLAALSVTACSRRPEAPFPELEASGMPGDLGLAQGRAFASQIRANLEFYLHWLSQSGQVPTARLFELARGFGPVLEEHFPSMLEEIDGIAQGAGMRPEEILLINARTDIMALAEAEIASEKVPACTALAIQGRVRGKQVLALCQNWDWDPVLADAPVVLRLRPSNGPALVTLVEAGMIGKIGTNEHRLGVCLNFLGHQTDGRPDTFGVPIHCLLRAAMDCSSIEEAVATVASAPRCASANFMLAQHGAGGPRALDLEISANAVATLKGGDAGLVHTNHFLDPELALGCTSGRGPSTMTRFATAEKLMADLEPTVADPVRRAQIILESRDKLPYPISREHNPDPSSSTLAGIIMDLTRNRFILTNGAPHRSEWIDRPGV
jgi:isopenicillin-N N-acyltransferase-like protein